MTEPTLDLPFSGTPDSLPVLPRGFYQRPTEKVARDLLGKILVRRGEEGVTAIRINEVEAYLGVDDPACHTFAGRRTRRTESMWGEAGHAYVYLVYGVHSCLNVVTVGEGVPEAVLIRGGDPFAGVDLMRLRRGPKVRDRSLTDGPGKLCQALAVTREQDGVDLSMVGGPLMICSDPIDQLSNRVRMTPRIGVEYAGAAAAWPLRFVHEASE
jgi:DNA-3-methyladenine glycosylase